jgi:GntR family transcriptional regulator
MRWNETLAPSPAPLWFQISERLRSAITAGEFKPGDVLPSETAINAAFKVSRTTARASLDRLRQDGLISRQSGRGSVVLKPRVEQPVNQLASFSDDMRRRGLRASYATFTADVQRTTPEAATALALPPGAPAFRINRLLLADDEPIGMSESWLAPAVLADRSPTPDELDRGSLYAWLARHLGLRIEGAQEYIEAAIADGDMARRLDVDPGFPLLVARRRSWREDGTAIEYAVMHYRADRYRFRIDLTGP